MRARIVGGVQRTVRQIEALVRRKANKGLASAAAFLRERLKVTVGVQADRYRDRSGQWRAKTRATPGAPPRRVSGRGQQSITWRWDGKGSILFAMLFYMKAHEKRGHPWMRPTVEKYRSEIKRIIGAGVKGKIS